jgi:hypothetical protein
MQESKVIHRNPLIRAVHDFPASCSFLRVPMVAIPRRNFKPQLGKEVGRTSRVPRCAGQ